MIRWGAGVDEGVRLAIRCPAGGFPCLRSAPCASCRSRSWPWRAPRRVVRAFRIARTVPTRHPRCVSWSASPIIPAPSRRRSPDDRAARIRRVGAKARQTCDRNRDPLVPCRRIQAGTPCRTGLGPHLGDQVIGSLVRVSRIARNPVSCSGSSRANRECRGAGPASPRWGLVNHPGPTERIEGECQKRYGFHSAPGNVAPSAAGRLATPSADAETIRGLVFCRRHNVRPIVRNSAAAARVMRCG